MDKTLIQKALCLQFNKQIKSLTFSGKKKFQAVDPNGECAFTLQDEFTGSGEYRYVATVSMISQETPLSAVYRFSGYVKIDCSTEEPTILFKDSISMFNVG